jgi:hypothetical protein
MKNAFALMALVGLVGARTLGADVWDQTTNNDDDTTTNNVLMHGTDQVHDLADLATGAGDRDWYNVTVRPFSSYEVVVEGQTGDLNFDAASIRNSGTQATVFLIQNLTAGSCNVNVHYFGANGTNLGSTIAAVAGHGLLTLQTASAVGGQSGSARVTHDCGYGGLAGKAVALEPSTGFTFDTEMSPRPR